MNTLGILSSLATVGAFLISVSQLMMSGRVSTRENALRLALMFHSKVFKEYNKINQEINENFLGLNSNLNSHLGVFFINIIIPLIILCIIPLPFYHGKSAEIFSLWIILAVFLEILWIVAVSRGSLVVDGRWNTILQNEKLIKESSFGLVFTVSVSIVVVSIWVTLLFDEYGNILSNLATLVVFMAILLFEMLILIFVSGNIKSTAARLLWKSRVSQFAKSLPYLFVKTKTGNIYYGQLYDLLDSKVLVLRKSRLMHGGQIIEDSSLVTKMSEEGDYWNVRWKDIESIKIVEDGLYAPPDNPSSNFGPHGTGESSEKDDGNKPESTTEKNGK